jgi:hypothetical protein
MSKYHHPGCLAGDNQAALDYLGINRYLNNMFFCPLHHCAFHCLFLSFMQISSKEGPKEIGDNGRLNFEIA